MSADACRPQYRRVDQVFDKGRPGAYHAAHENCDESGGVRFGLGQRILRHTVPKTPSNPSLFTPVSIAFFS